MNKHRLLLFLISSAYSSLVLSAPTSEEIASEITNNISEEYVTCGSFYAIASGGAENSGDKKLSSDLNNARDRALENAYLAATSGRSEEMARKVTLARLELNLNEMKKSIESNYSNISILLNKHSKRCQWIMNNPEEFMSEWQNKIFKKYGMQ